MNTNPFNPTVFLLLFFLFVTAEISAQPTFNKVFSPNTIAPGGNTTLTFNITNGAVVPVMDLDFTDNLPAGVTVSDPVNSTVSCIGGTLTAAAGSGVISYSGGSLAASSSCTITVTVTSSTAGTHTNVTGSLTSSAGDSGTATDDLTVSTNRPSFSKSFSPSTIDLGEKSTLTFTIDNTLNASDLSNIDFTDVLPTGLEIANPSNAITTCGTANSIVSLTASSGTSTITLDADQVVIFPPFPPIIYNSLAAGSSCTVTVDVISSGGIGTFTNVSGELTSINASGGGIQSSGYAIDDLEVTREKHSYTKRIY